MLGFAIVCSPIGGRPRSIRAMRGRIDGHVFSILLLRLIVSPSCKAGLVAVPVKSVARA